MKILLKFYNYPQREMSKLHEFIVKNTRSIEKRKDDIIKPGVHDYKIFQEINEHDLKGDDLVLYFLVGYKIMIKNDEFKQKLIKSIENIEDLFLKTIVFCELNYFEDALKSTEELKTKFSLQMEIIGAKAKYKKHNKIEKEAMFAEITNISASESINERKEYNLETDDYIFTEQKITALNIQEQKIVILIVFYIIRLMELDKTRSNEYKEYASAFLDRLSFIRNENFQNKEFIVQYFKNILRDEIKDVPFTSLYDKEMPFIPCFEYSKVLADNMFKNFKFESALNIYTILEQQLKIAKCYLGMGKDKEMVVELTKIKEDLEKRLEKINTLGLQENCVSETEYVKNHSTEKGSDLGEMTPSEIKFTLVNTYHLLAEIKKDTTYYDLSYKLYPSHETLKQKAMYFVRERRMEDALETLEKALIHTKNDIKLFHMIGCLKIACNQDGEPFLHKILEIDPDNYETLLNIADFKIEQRKPLDALIYLKRAFKMHQTAGCAEKIIAILTKEEKKEELKKFLSFIEDSKKE